MPLVSYIRNSLRFWYYAFLSACCQNVEKKLGSLGKFGRERGLNFLRDLTKKSVNFSALITSNIRLLLFFGEEDQETKLVRLVRKKSWLLKKNSGKLQLVDEIISLPEPKFYPRIYGDCNPS